MDPHAARAALAIAAFVTLSALALLPFEPRDSAEYVVTWLALAVGLLSLSVVIVVIRRSLH